MQSNAFVLHPRGSSSPHDMPADVAGQVVDSRVVCHETRAKSTHYHSNNLDNTGDPQLHLSPKCPAAPTSCTACRAAIGLAGHSPEVSIREIHSICGAEMRYGGYASGQTSASGRLINRSYGVGHALNRSSILSRRDGVQIRLFQFHHSLLHT